MPALRQSVTAVIGRGEIWQGRFATEPYECGWAVEAVVFLRHLDGLGGARASVQVSPDGMHWVDEGTALDLPSPGNPVTFVRVRRFGNWLRLAGEVPAGSSSQVVATLHLKG